eukprot:5650132-Pyramimonas_sp.AAC.1
MDGFLSELGMVLSALAGQQAASPHWARLYDNVARYSIKMGLVRVSHARSNCVFDCDLVAAVLVSPATPACRRSGPRAPAKAEENEKREKALGPLSALGD